jgi:hypothetical protein
LAVDVHPIAFAYAARLLGKVEGAGRLGRSEEGKRTVIVRLHGLHIGVAFKGTNLGIEGAKKLAAAAGAQRSKFRAKVEFADAISGERSVGVDACGIVDWAEPAGPLATRLFDKPRGAVRHDRHHGNERRKRAATTTKPSKYGADAGPILG